jgi:hypothetical protein
MDNYRLSRVKGASAALAAAGEVTLQIATDTVKVVIRRVKIKHTAGTALNFVPRIGKAAGFVASSIDQEFVGSSTAVADLFDVVAEAATYTDADGRLYLRPAPDAGANNTFDYEVYYDVIR